MSLRLGSRHELKLARRLVFTLFSHPVPARCIAAARVYHRLLLRYRLLRRRLPHFGRISPPTARVQAGVRGFDARYAARLHPGTSAHQLGTERNAQTGARGHVALPGKLDQPERPSLPTPQTPPPRICQTMERCREQKRSRDLGPHPVLSRKSNRQPPYA